MFELHPQLQQDCLVIGRFELCLVLLSKDANYPWCILVPEREQVTEIHQLSEQDRQQLMSESCLLAETLAELFAADKMNVAAIGNMVPQLHIHHVVRYRNDAAWPKPVWGAVTSLPYKEQELVSRAKKIQQANMAGFESSLV